MFLEDIWERENLGQWEELRSKPRGGRAGRQPVQLYEQDPRALWAEHDQL